VVCIHYRTQSVFLWPILILGILGQAAESSRTFGGHRKVAQNIVTFWWLLSGHQKYYIIFFAGPPMAAEPKVTEPGAALDSLIGDGTDVIILQKQK
jgi:hypothetical protein